jgi:predicted  nucleic acid-binding Zn-ribbon protein
MSTTRPATDEEVADIREWMETAGAAHLRPTLFALIARIDAERERAEKAEESRRIAVAVMSEHHDRAQAALSAAQQQIAALREALEWYRDRAAGCRKITSEGNTARHELDADGGARARAALAQTEGAEG